MNAIDLAVEALKTDEGFRPVCYDDKTGQAIKTFSGGNITVGYGLNLSVGMSEEDAMMLLRTHVIRLNQQINEACPDLGTLPDSKKAVLLNIGYNVGIHGLLGFHHMVSALDAFDYAKAADEILDSDAARKLPARYSRLAEEMRAE